MKLIEESNNLNDYLIEDEYVDYTNEDILRLTEKIFKDCKNDIEKIRVAFEYTRDKIDRSWDIKSTRVTRKASEVLKYKEGICYAKSMLLAALLRATGIPTGFCYQKLTLGDTPDTGYCIHALNAVYISELKKWIRIDARGNTNGKNAQFSLDKEQLAFNVRDEFREVNYPTIYVHPLKSTVDTLKNNSNCINMIKCNLPKDID